MKKMARFLKTTAIGGILFLLPLIVIGALIGQAVPVVLTIAKALGENIPVHTTEGITLLVFLAILLILATCFAAGLLARRSWGKRLAAWFEKNLVLMFPRYTIIREQMAGTIGGDVERPRMLPVLATFADVERLGFEVERNDEGMVTVYLPGSPDPWSGSVAFLKADRVRSLGIDFAEVISTFEKLGRESLSLVHSRPEKGP